MALLNLDVTTDVNTISYIDFNALKLLSYHNKYNISLTERYINKINWPVFWRAQRNIPEIFINHFARYITDWTLIVKHQQLSEEFLRKNKNILNWRCISQYQKLTESFIEEFKDKICWDAISSRCKLSLEFVEKHHSKLAMYELPLIYHHYTEDFLLKIIDKVPIGSILTNHCRYSENFLRQISDRLDWTLVFLHQELSEKFITDFVDKIDWLLVVQNQHNISQSFINKHIANRPDLVPYVVKHQVVDREFLLTYQDVVVWDDLIQFQNLSEDLLREFADKLNWRHVSNKRYLSEKFISDFADQLNWSKICRYSKLSERFIIANIERIQWHVISGFQKLSESFIIEYENMLNIEDLAYKNNLTNLLIEKYGERIEDWNYITCSLQLSDANLRKYKYKFIEEDWYNLSKYQNLSEIFIHEFKNKLSWDYISSTQMFSLDFAKEHSTLLNIDHIRINTKIAYDTIIYCEYYLPKNNELFN